MKAEVTQWTSLEYSKEIVVRQKPNVSLGRMESYAHLFFTSSNIDDFVSFLIYLLVIYEFTVGSQRPTYPSSKSKATDWDKLEAQVKKEVC